jgi:hypothetical protein
MVHDGPRLVRYSGNQSWAPFRSQTMDCLWTMNSSLAPKGSKMMGRSAAIMDGWWAYFTGDHSSVSSHREFDMAGSCWFQWVLLTRHGCRISTSVADSPLESSLGSDGSLVNLMDGCIGWNSSVTVSHCCFYPQYLQCSLPTINHESIATLI